MEASIDQIVNWILTLSPLSIYLIFTIIAYGENVVPPVPGDVLVVFGGYLAAEGIVNFSYLLMVTSIASVLGFMNMYAFGYYFGDQIDTYRSEFWLMKIIDVKYFDRCKLWMHRYGQAVIVANRFLAGTRSVIAVIAGLTKMKIITTIASSTVSSVLWNLILLALGWFVHENWLVIGDYLNIYGWIILSLIVLILAVRYFYLWFFANSSGPKRIDKKTPNDVDKF
ncbi:MAG: DedA family protein [Balneolaceae bacterium]